MTVPMFLGSDAQSRHVMMWGTCCGDTEVMIQSDDSEVEKNDGS